MEWFNELYHLFDELLQSLASIFLGVFDELFHGFDELPHALLLLLLLSWLLIIQGIVLFTIFLIVIWYFFNETICIWDYYILENWRHMTTDWWNGTNHFNGIIF